MNAHGANETIVIEDGGVFLAKFLNPIQQWLDQDNVSEICVNQPGAVWVEEMGALGMQQHVVQEMDAKCIGALARQVAAKSKQSVSAETPLLSAALPTGERIQIILPPCAPAGGGFSIRKQVVRDLALEDYVKAGAFDDSRVTDLDQVTDVDRKLQGLLIRSCCLAETTLRRPNGSQD